MLKISNLRASYDGVPALHGVDLRVDEGQFVGLIGPNGAGKTTLVKAISGTVDADATELSFHGTDLVPLSGHERAEQGIIHVPQGRRVFGGLTVEENLLMGAFRQAARPGAATEQVRVYELFPVLSRLRTLHASSLSGGQQQMLAVARGLMAQPKLLILDEPSMGLAPVIVEEIFDVLASLRATGELSVLLVEQLAQEALELCDRVTVLESGEVVAEGSQAELAGRSEVVDAYLGEA